MTKWFDLDHNSGDWFAARAGVATSSQFDKIITRTGNPSKQAEDYANLLVAELILGRAIERNFNAWALEWGRQHEAEAINLYEFDTGYTVKNGGFFVDDNFTIGASPDARVFDGDEMVGLAEIKCPENPAIHMEFLLMQKMNPKYIQQVQGQLLVSGAKWVDWFSYFPEMPPARVRVERDEEYIKLLKNALDGFGDIMDKKVQQLIKLDHLDERPIKFIEEVKPQQPEQQTQEDEMRF